MPDSQTIEVPDGLTFDTMLFEHPDEPLPNIAAFDRLDDPLRVSKLVGWIEPQKTCSTILNHHGADGLRRVLVGIAKAASRLKVPMMPRVRSMAEYLELPVY